jgi:hypothetical protein
VGVYNLGVDMCVVYRVFVVDDVLWDSMSAEEGTKGAGETSELNVHILIVIYVFWIYIYCSLGEHNNLPSITFQLQRSPFGTSSD